MMNKAEKKNYCTGCRDNYYNHSGNSTTGECWCLASAKVVKLAKVGIWQPPPYQWMPQTTLSCHRPEGYVWLKREDERVVKAQKAKAS